MCGTQNRMNIVRKQSKSENATREHTQVITNKPLSSSLDCFRSLTFFKPNLPHMVVGKIKWEEKEIHLCCPVILEEGREKNIIY